MASKNAKKANIPFQMQKISKQEFFAHSAYGLLIGALGVVWLAQELGWIDSNVPFGPLSIILLGLLMMFSSTKN